MKVKDYGTNDPITKEKSVGSYSPHVNQKKLEFINKNLPNRLYVSENVKEKEKMQKPNQTKDKVFQSNENSGLEENSMLKSDLNLTNITNNKGNDLVNYNNNLNINNCINKIDFDKNIIVLNKLNLKEFNNINKDLKNEKKNDMSSKKGEVINMLINEKFNYNKEVSNSIKTSYEYLTDNFLDSFDNFGQINSNNDFPNEIIDKFLERKRNKNKEKNNYNYISSFGTNPLETLKNIQTDLFDPTPPQKSSKMTQKQYKLNQKNLKDKNILLQKYIKSFPVLNCPESKIFKFNQYYYFNKNNEEKTINIFNNGFNKNLKKNNSYNNEITEEEKNNKNKSKDDSEEETINRHIKKKLINSKRSKSKNKN